MGCVPVEGVVRLEENKEKKIETLLLKQRSLVRLTAKPNKKRDGSAVLLGYGGGGGSLMGQKLIKKSKT